MNEMKGPITIYCPKDKEEIWNQVREIAGKEGKNVSQLIFEALETYVNKYYEKRLSIPLDEFMSNIAIELYPSLGQSPAEWDWENTPDDFIEDIRKMAKAWFDEATKRLQKRKESQTKASTKIRARWKCTSCGNEFIWFLNANTCPKCLRPTLQIIQKLEEPELES